MLAPHPADIWPKPVDEGGVVFSRRSGEICEPADQDLIATTLVGDGSASRLPIPDLQLSVFAIICLSTSGTPTLVMQAPVWRSLHQTAQAVEHAMVAAAQELAGENAVIYGDCANVVREAGRPQELQLRGKAAYAGVRRHVLKMWKKRGDALHPSTQNAGAYRQARVSPRKGGGKSKC